MRFYVSGGPENAQRVAEINEALAHNGHIITAPSVMAGTGYDALFEAA